MLTLRLRSRILSALVLTILLTAANAAAQTLLVDTGQPTGTFGPLLCSTACGGGSTFQNLAGQFTLTDAYSISSVQAWIQAPSTGGQLAVVIRSDSAGLPGASVYSQTYTVPNQTTSGWETFMFSTQPVLQGDTPYWLSFEPVVGSAISYDMTESAPNPLPQYALYNSLNSGWFTEAFGLGMRISGTPAQSASLLVDTGAGPAGAFLNGSVPIYNNSSSDFEYLAGQFTLDQAASLESVAGWMQVYTAGNVNVSIYAGNQQGLYNNIVPGKPGTAVYTQSYAEGATSQNGWAQFQFSEPFPTLSAGTYWLSFEPPQGSFYATMSPGVPTPLPNYAYYYSLNRNWLNQSFTPNSIQMAMQVYGSPLAAQASGTAARAIMTGTDFGIPFTPQDAITGGDGQPNTQLWNFNTPAGWSYGRGTIIPNGLQAGAFAATSGPCNVNPGTCGTSGARGVAYRTWTNTGNSPVNINMNVVLEGEFEALGGVTSAGVYVIDATTFTNTINASGLAAPQFLLNNATLTSLSTGGTSLASLFPSSEVKQNFFNTYTSSQEPLNQLLNIPLTTGFFTVNPQQSVTVVFDVTAYAAPDGWSNFANTLEPSPTLPLFTDANGDAVPQMIAVGPSAPVTTAPATLTLAPTTASYPEGTNVTVTATVLDANSNPVPNAAVFFAFNSGPNAGPAGPIATDVNGNATFTYTDNGGAGTDVITASLGTLTATPVSITWTVPGPLDHITISPATATISSGGTRAYTAAGFDRFNNSIGDVTAQTTFTIAPDGSCTAATCTASVMGVHTVTGDDSGKTAQASLTVNSGKTNPVITWATPAPITFGTPLCSQQLDATANVPGKFVYSPGAGTILHAGAQTLSVTFTPTNTTAYNTVTASVKLQVNQAKPLVLWIPLPLVYGTPLGPLQLDALSLPPGTFVYTPPAGTILPPGLQKLSAVFTPKDTTDFQTITVTATVDVVKKH